MKKLLKDYEDDDDLDNMGDDHWFGSHWDDFEEDDEEIT